MENLNKTVKIVNITQAIKYMKNGVNPIRTYYTNKIVFEFEAVETKELFERWKNYTL